MDIKWAFWTLTQNEEKLLEEAAERSRPSAEIRAWS